MNLVSQRHAPLGSRLATWLVLGAVLLGSLAYAFIGHSSSQSASARVVQLEREVKCPSCIDLPVYNSSTASSSSIRVFINDQVAQGRTNSEILDSLVAAYGAGVLMTPAGASVDSLLWLLPLALAALVGGELVLRRRRGGRTGPTPAFIEDLEMKDEALVLPVVSTAPDRQSVPSPKGRPLSKLPPKYLLLGGSLSLVTAGVLLVGSAVFGHGSPKSAPLSSQQLAAEVVRGEILASRGQDVGALKAFSQVLAVEPTQPQALAYQGWLLYQAGNKDHSAVLVRQGKQFVVRAVQLSPKYATARLFFGLILLQADHDPRGAVQQFNMMLAERIGSGFISAADPEIKQAYLQSGEPLPSQIK